MKHIKSYNEMLLGADPNFQKITDPIHQQINQQREDKEKAEKVENEKNRAQRKLKIENEARQKGWDGKEDLYNFLVRIKVGQKQGFFQKVGSAIKGNTDEDFILMYDVPAPTENSSWKEQDAYEKTKKERKIQKQQLANQQK